jgi:hypothetical protein
VGAGFKTNRMHWKLSHRGDEKALPLADTHYSRQKPGTPQFVKPGSCLVLLAEDSSALWVTSFPKREFVKHEWRGAWECSMFHSKGSVVGSELIREAVAITCQHYGEPPSLGMITFVDPKKVAGFFRRVEVRDADGFIVERYTELSWGYSFQRAGFKHVGWTKGGLFALQLLPDRMPPPQLAIGMQVGLFEGVA